MHPNRVRLAVAATAVAALAALTPGVASAGEAPAGPVGPRLERACLRIPNLQLRTERLHARLQGDAATVGSLAWLQAQVDRAEAAGRTQLVTVLRNRLAVRTSTLAVLEQRAAELERLATWCSEHAAS